MVILIYKAALAALGIGIVIDILNMWKLVSRMPDQVDVTGERFVRDALPLVGQQYDRAEALAISVYRLHRALLTGSTVPAPGEEDASVSLHQLREDFMREVNSIDKGMLAKHRYVAPPQTVEQISIEKSGSIDRELDMVRDYNEQEARQLIRKLGPGGYLKRIESIKDEAERAAAWDKAGAKVAASMSRIVSNGGRNAHETIRRQDMRALGYARVCSHPTKPHHPCSFCAMLMSREYDYVTAKSAKEASGRRGTRRNGEAYHDNCDCVTETIYSEEQWQDSRFDLNRQYSDEWGRVTINAPTAREARILWRRHIEGR